MPERWEADLYECTRCGEFYEDYYDALECERNDRKATLENSGD